MNETIKQLLFTDELTKNLRINVEIKLIYM